MKLLLIVTSLFLFLGLTAFSQPSRVPAFSDYQVPVSKSRPKAPDLKSHKKARLFRTSLRNATKDGVNFAGHFALTYWGCGSSCGVGAIVNLKTGAVFFPDQLNGVWAQDWPGSDSIPFGFRKNSRLLVLHGYLPNDYHGNRLTYGYHYFEWNGTRLKRVKFVPEDWEESE
jgi:hypothetical protein